MEEAKEQDKTKTYFWCFWIAVILIFVVFILPIESHTVGNVTMNYTLWNKITGAGPSSGEIRLSH